AKHLDEFHQVRPVLLVGGDLDQRQVAFQHRTVGDVFGQQDIHKLFQAGFQAMRAALIRVRAKGHPGNRFIFRWADSKRINIDGQAAGEGSYAIQYTRLVFHISDDSLHAILDFLATATAPNEPRKHYASRLGISLYRIQLQPGLRVTPSNQSQGSMAVSTSGLLGRRIMSWSAAPAG